MIASFLLNYMVIMYDYADTYCSASNVSHKSTVYTKGNDVKVIKNEKLSR